MVCHVGPGIRFMIDYFSSLGVFYPTTAAVTLLSEIVGTRGATTVCVHIEGGGGGYE